MQFPRIILDSTWPKHLVIVGYYNDALHSRENSDLAQSGMTQRKLTEWSSPVEDGLWSNSIHSVP